MKSISCNNAEQTFSSAISFNWILNGNRPSNCNVPSPRESIRKEKIDFKEAARFTSKFFPRFRFININGHENCIRTDGRSPWKWWLWACARDLCDDQFVFKTYECPFLPRFHWYSLRSCLYTNSQLTCSFLIAGKSADRIFPIGKWTQEADEKQRKMLIRSPFTRMKTLERLHEWNYIIASWRPQPSTFIHKNFHSLTSLKFWTLVWNSWISRRCKTTVSV